MSGSGNLINYNIRTSKSVERRMILATVKELFKKTGLSSCRYIGFGSTYFTDFKLFHRELHIDDMISIESDNTILERAEFNKPFKCIKIVPGKSKDVLLTLEFKKDQLDFLWMDYDNELEYDFFIDIERIFSKIQPGSVYLMSCNKQLSRYKKIDDFNDIFGELVPNDITGKDFTGEGDFLLIRRMLLNKIEEELKGRNYSLPTDKHLVFRQLFFFTYKDGAPMLSFGGFLDLKSNDFSPETYNLNMFNFITTGPQRFHIDPPSLTYKEIYLLNSYLPDLDSDFQNVEELQFIPLTDRNRYYKLYKFLPIYMDVIH